MRKMLIIAFIALLFLSGCSIKEVETTDNNNEIQDSQTLVNPKSGEELVRRFKLSHSGESITYSFTDDINKDGTKDTFVVTGDKDPKLWYLEPNGNSNLILEVWGKLSTAELIERGDIKHLVIMVTNEPSINQIWVYTIDNKQPKQIFTSISNESIRITEDGFNMFINDYDDNQGKSNLSIIRYIWDEEKGAYVEDENGYLASDKTTDDSSNNNSQKILKTKNTTIDPSKLKPYYDSDTGKFGYKYEDERVVLKPQYHSAKDFVGNIAVVSKSQSQYGCIDVKGTWVVEPIYEYIGQFKEGLAHAKKDGKWGFINQDGIQVIDFIYDDASYFSEGMAAVKVNSDWGYIDKTGNMVIKNQFDSYNAFKDGKVEVKYGGKYGTMDKEGKLQWTKIDTYESTQLYPPDNLNFDQDFIDFYKSFLTALKNKNTEFIVNHLDENILSNSGYDRGKEGFVDYWKLRDNPEKSEFWNEIENIISLKGDFIDDNKEIFVAPYVFANFPDDLAPFDYGVCIGENISVYIEPNQNSMIMEKLNYDIIMVLDWNFKITNSNGQSDIWNKIQLPSGMKGYVKSKYIRSPLDYRIQFSKDLNGKWKIDYFIAGD